MINKLRIWLALKLIGGEPFIANIRLFGTLHVSLNSRKEGHFHNVIVDLSNSKDDIAIQFHNFVEKGVV